MSPANALENIPYIRGEMRMAAIEFARDFPGNVREYVGDGSGYGSGRCLDSGRGSGAGIGNCSEPYTGFGAGTGDGRGNGSDSWFWR